MDKSIGTNLHLWRFFTLAEQSRANSYTLVQYYAGRVSIGAGADLV